MTRVLFIGAPVEPVDPALDYRERLGRTGDNTGNLLIGAALRRQIAYSTYSHGVERAPETIDDEFDLIAIPAANWVFENFDFGWLADFLDRTTRPLVMVGLGAQAPSSRESRIAVPAGTERFLKVVSERSAKIGVRGAFTADVLSTLGIENVALTGCPSLYWTLEPRIEIEQPPYHDALRVSVNGSRNITLHSYSPALAKRATAALLHLAMTRGYEYVLQDELPEIDLLFTQDVDQFMKEHVEAVLADVGLEVPAYDYIAFVRNRCRLFFSVDEWADHICTTDFSIGARFHGNLIALVNGVPAVMLVHDARTAELCELIKAPSLGLETELQDLRGIYEAADYTDFARTYVELYEQYVRFFADNSVPHNLTAPANPAVRAEVADTHTARP